MRVAWSNLNEAVEDAAVEVSFYPLAPGASRTARTFLILSEPRCCIAHAPADPSGAIEVFSPDPIAVRGGMPRLSGRWRLDRFRR